MGDLGKNQSKKEQRMQIMNASLTFDYGGNASYIGKRFAQVNLW